MRVVGLVTDNKVKKVEERKTSAKKPKEDNVKNTTNK